MYFSQGLNFNQILFIKSNIYIWMHRATKGKLLPTARWASFDLSQGRHYNEAARITVTTTAYQIAKQSQRAACTLNLLVHEAKLWKACCFSLPWQKRRGEMVGFRGAFFHLAPHFPFSPAKVRARITVRFTTTESNNCLYNNTPIQKLNKPCIQIPLSRRETQRAINI